MNHRSAEHVAFGAAIRSLRAQRELTQEALAERSQMDRTYLSGIERGVRNPSLTNILRIATSLEVTPAELFVRAEGERAARVDASSSPT